MPTEKPHHHEDRHEDRGPDAREPQPLISKQVAAVVTAVIVALFGGGGLASHTSLSTAAAEGSARVGAKIDAQSEKLDSLKLQLAELRGQVLSSEAASARAEAAVSVISGRVASLEQVSAGLKAQVDELLRRSK